MKKYYQLTILFSVGLLLHSCKKTSTINPPVTDKCKLIKVTTLSGSSVSGYSTDGKLTSLKHYSGNSLQVSTIIGGSIMESSYTSSSGFPMIQTVTYDGSIVSNQLPVKASIAQTEGAITRTDVWTYYFFYDNKNRLERVREETIHVVGDWEYDLLIRYNDQDNVTSLKYVWTTGPNTSTTIVATGYDDKANPYSNLRVWKYLLSWDSSDPTSIFSQLSKNNPVNISLSDGNTRKLVYTYNNNGFPITKTTSTVNAGGAVVNTVTSYMEYICN